MIFKKIIKLKKQRQNYKDYKTNVKKYLDAFEKSYNLPDKKLVSVRRRDNGNYIKTYAVYD